MLQRQFQFFHIRYTGTVTSADTRDYDIGNFLSCVSILYFVDLRCGCDGRGRWFVGARGVVAMEPAHRGRLSRRQDQEFLYVMAWWTRLPLHYTQTQVSECRSRSLWKIGHMWSVLSNLRKQQRKRPTRLLEFLVPRQVVPSTGSPELLIFLHSEVRTNSDLVNWSKRNVTASFCMQITQNVKSQFTSPSLSKFVQIILN